MYNTFNKKVVSQPIYNLYGSDQSNFHQELSALVTEQSNPHTYHIDECSTSEMLHLINDEDKLVPVAVEGQIEYIAAAIDAIVDCLKSGGRLIYVGSGTSGRLGILDASECPPTFGVSPQLVQGVIAGGEHAILNAVEGMEDNEVAGKDEMQLLQVTAQDAVVGIAASGRTPYVISAIEEARQRGAVTIGLSNTKDSVLSNLCDYPIEVVVGPEAITGSTRMKAGTAQKLVLNMLSTCSMIKLGKVYNNYMVDLQATNAKLRERSIRIVQESTNASRANVEQALNRADGKVKLAILMLKSGLTAKDAAQILSENHGYLKQSLDATKNKKECIE